jgi:hypothetical protein
MAGLRAFALGLTMAGMAHALRLVFTRLAAIAGVRCLAPSQRRADDDSFADNPGAVLPGSCARGVGKRAPQLERR